MSTHVPQPNSPPLPSVKTPSVPALDRALSMLELLAESQEGLTLPELAHKLRVPKSSAHCILLTLERRAYLHRHRANNRYLFGSKFFALSQPALDQAEVRMRAMPHLWRMSLATGLTGHLAILARNEAVLVAKTEPPGAFKLATWVGKRIDVHSTGVGKVLIAYLSEDRLRTLLRDHSLPRHNDNTIATARLLLEELGRIRARGFATEDEEDALGLRSIGAPAFDESGDVVAALGLSGTTGQITSENLPLLVRTLKDCTAAVSQSLGWRRGCQRK